MSQTKTEDEVIKTFSRGYATQTAEEEVVALNKKISELRATLELSRRMVANLLLENEKKL